MPDWEITKHGFLLSSLYINSPGFNAKGCCLSHREQYRLSLLKCIITPMIPGETKPLIFSLLQ